MDGKGVAGVALIRQEAEEEKWRRKKGITQYCYIRGENRVISI